MPIIINTKSRRDTFFWQAQKSFFDRLLEIATCKLLLDAAHKLNEGDDSFRSTVNNYYKRYTFLTFFKLESKQM